ncbi:MAG TPA: T6SS immunity protein Tdi1 domain-containing protein [Gemmatimonadales bacterium]
MRTSLIIDEPLQIADPLKEWRWKVGPDARSLALSRSGDAFVLMPDGRVWWLDTGAGEFAEVAPTKEAFDQLLRDPKEARRLLLTPVVEEFIRLHGPFPPGRCLGYTQLPILGGAYTVENRWSAPASEHFGVTGEIHRQIHDLPDGTDGRLRVVD